MNITVWGENVHERKNPAVSAIYPDGMHNTIARLLAKGLPGNEIATATLEQPEHGLTQARLDATDVLLWWGHLAHDEVDDAVASAVRSACSTAWASIVLHSAH